MSIYRRLTFCIAVSGIGTLSLSCGQDDKAPLVEFAPPKAGEPARGGFLGIHTVPLPDCIKHHLLEGTEGGILVDIIHPDSPAAALGLKPHDVVTQVDDQKIFTTSQLAALLASRKAGSTLTLHFCRSGQKQAKSVTLAEAPLWPQMDVGAAAQRRKEAAAKLAQMIRHEPALADSFPDLLRQLAQEFPARETSNEWTRLLTHNDGLGKVQIREIGATKHLRVLNAAGAVEFEGEISSVEQREALPAPIRSRLDSVEPHAVVSE
jgi:membrane-associated protease RseP (regulator of RpoE activity)